MKTLMLSLLVFVPPLGAEAQTPTTDRKPGKTYGEQIFYSAMLRQEYGSYSEADREAIVAELERIIREGTEKQAWSARRVLVHAATENGEGIPYPKAAESLIRQYEALEDKTGSEARSVAYALIDASREDYVRAVFEAAEPPSEPCMYDGGGLPYLVEEGPPPPPPEERRCPYKTEFCVVGKLLINQTEDDVPDPENFLNICYGPTHSYENGSILFQVF